jgi:hypothetical protein
VQQINQTAMASSTTQGEIMNFKLLMGTAVAAIVLASASVSASTEATISTPVAPQESQSESLAMLLAGLGMMLTIARRRSSSNED